MTFLGLTLDKLLVIGVLAVLLIGPERMPAVAERLGQLVRGVRDLANGAKERVREEMGPEFDEVDWRRLDPRQYDPRRIVRDALKDDPAPAQRSAQERTPRPRRPKPADAQLDGPAPFDDEAT